MKTTRKTAAAFIISWLLLSLMPGSAWALPYESVEWQEFPDVRLMEAKLGKSTEIYPDWEPGVLRSAEYGEIGGGWFEREGLVTVRSTRLAYANLIHYAESGQAYIVNRSLPVNADQQITFSFKLPLDDNVGVTRLIIWQQRPDPGWQTLLARHPHYSIEPVPGLEFERWFQGGDVDTASVPWEGRFRPGYPPPAGITNDALPAVHSEIDSSGLVRTKDCAVQFNGYKRLAYDEYGGFGQWMLGWGSEIRIEFEIPPDFPQGFAELRLFGHSDSAFGIPINPVIEVNVNGWVQSSDSAYRDFDATAQPIALNVSQYLEAGINIIEIRLGSLADSEWLLERFELWME